MARQDTEKIVQRKISWTSGWQGVYYYGLPVPLGNNMEAVKQAHKPVESLRRKAKVDLNVTKHDHSKRDSCMRPLSIAEVKCTIVQCLAKSASPLVQLQLSLRHRDDRDCPALLSEFSIVSLYQPVSTFRVSCASITRF
jgi:hypothetical protein